MSDDQKKQDDGKKGAEVKMPGGLPGLGATPSKSPIPGLGAKPSKAALPGLGGQPSKAPLPGLGAQPSKAPLPGIGQGAGALPGLGKKPAAPVPAFLQQPEPEPEPAAPEGPSKEEIARDPFGHAPVASTTAVRPSYAPNDGLIGASVDPGVAYSESDAGRSNKPIIIGAVAIAVIALLFGFLMGKGKSTREALNITIRDALIVEYEIKKVATLFNEIQTVVNTALQKTAQREYDKTHVAFLSQKVQGNPIKPMIFTERNYKRFDALAVQWLMDYNQKWFKLDKLIQTHRMKTTNDEPALKAAKGGFTKLIETGFGVVFTRSKKTNNQLQANVVVVAPGAKEGMFKVQAEPGTFGDERELYNPEPGDGKLTEEPDKFVVAVGEASKAGLLGKATQGHFKEYHGRLKEMSDLMRSMNELQANLLQKVAEICSQDPVLLGKIDPIEELENYKKNDKGAGAAPAAE